MIYISEWLPNPEGADTSGEFVELFNNGASGVNLAGWTLETQNGKKAKLTGSIGAGKYLILPRSTTKLTLRNSDEKLFLYDAQNKPVDQSGFFGAALDGKSFSRLRQGYGGQARVIASEPQSSRAPELFVWVDPTPGGANVITANNLITANNYPHDIPLNPQFGHPQIFGIIFGSALVLSAIIFYALKKHENLSNIFFGRDEEAWL
ncbi:MAG: lamin tail domain-containing protein [Candidatus Liptonbacteria bacterium]|nr:lamin tail domain-containing protein [Candidatus Liptonbacteria bacterium]